MRIISLNVGMPRSVNWQGRIVETGIFKEPVSGRVRLHQLNLKGDAQADLTVHGGLDKAVYAYPSEHYEFWRAELPGMELPWGMFGENFTTEGLLEKDVRIGERFRVGDTEVMATEPRMPCYKLGIKFGRADIIRRFLASRRTGFYFRVIREGTVATGDVVERVNGASSGVGVADITELYASAKKDPAMLRRAIEAEALPESWKNHFRRFL